VSVLDLFNGQLDINTILNIPIAFLRELCDSRVKLINEKEQAKAEALNKASSTSDNGNYY
jgi:hypothetical protein